MVTEQEQNAAAAATTPRRVVVAEDESLIRLDIVEILRDNGFDVVGEAGDGETAVQLATELRPDLVIMDVKMPQLDGISAAERLSKNHIAPVVLLIVSNVFMTYAWYWHLKNPTLKASPMWVVVLASWGIAFFEYCFQVPGNRLGYRAGITAGQLKVLQEAITLAVFCAFAAVVLKEKLTWNYYVGFAFVLIGVVFVFSFGKTPMGE